MTINGLHHAAISTPNIERLMSWYNENFGFEVPIFVDGVNSELLDPRKTWQNSEEYDVQARKLIDMFVANFEQYMDHVDNSIKEIVLR